MGIVFITFHSIKSRNYDFGCLGRLLYALKGLPNYAKI